MPVPRRPRRAFRFAPCALAATAALAFAAAGSAPRGGSARPLVATFSIVAVDPANGDLGVAVQSKFPNVRAVVPWARAGVGAVATQSFARLDYASDGLELMARGASAREALDILLRRDPGREQRQVGMVDARGGAATWTGRECFPWAGARIGQPGWGPSAVGPGEAVAGTGYTAQGNILVSAETVAAMARAFEAAKGELADRLMAALVAGGKAGGDRRGEQSAALLVVRKGAGYDGSDAIADLSVYDHEAPIAELERLYRLNRLYFTGSKPENLIPVTAEIARELQEIWRARGFWEGEPDGVVDARFQKVLVDYMGWENYDLRIAAVEAVDLEKGQDLVIDREVLEDIRAVFASGRWKPRGPDPR